MKIGKVVLHLLVVVFLTVISQVGGMVYLVCLLSISKKHTWYMGKRLALFLLIYLVVNKLVLPNTAPVFGRERIQESEHLTSAMPLTALLNRNYVRPELNRVLNKTAEQLARKYNGIKLVYLDANFPFINGFPLLPHLSHNDGNKIDLSFVYENREHTIVNNKPSRSGYGVFENPMQDEANTAAFCKTQGFWQYDYPRFLTLGQSNPGLKLSEEATKFLVQELASKAEVKKIFIEPHLKDRLRIESPKVRFHGCGAVRHDDHIHIQL
jgi:hypothetical protein